MRFTDLTVTSSNLSLSLSVCVSHSGRRSTVVTDVSCLVSVGCGIYPPDPIGNTNIVDAITKVTEFLKLREKIKNTAITLTSAVSSVV